MKQTMFTFTVHIINVAMRGFKIPWMDENPEMNNTDSQDVDPPHAGINY